MISKPSLAVPPWADTGDAIQPDVTYIASGFPHTNDKPTRQTMNWVLNYATNGVQYLTARGIPDWDSAQTYTAGDVVRFQGRFYSALQSNNTNRSPAVQTSWWALWFVFPADLNTLYITPAQVAASYLTTNQANATFATTANLTTATQNLQNQINAITAVTGAGYRAGNGISIDTNNFIINTLPNVNADWNATSGGGQILNKPTFATVATSGNYTDLSNRPVLATVATSGRYNDLIGLPAVQVNSDWNAASGLAQILNKPQIINAGSEAQVTANLTVQGYIRCPNVITATSPDGTRSVALSCANNANPVITSSTGVMDASNCINMPGAPSINYNRINNPAMSLTLAGGGNSYIELKHPEIATVRIGANTNHGINAGYIWVDSGQFAIESDYLEIYGSAANFYDSLVRVINSGSGMRLEFDVSSINPHIQSTTGAVETRNTSLEVYGDNLTVIGNFFRAISTSNNAMYVEIDVRGTDPLFASTTGKITYGSTIVIQGANGLETGNITIHPTGTGAGYLQFNNNGQFGNADPWIFSATGILRCQSSFAVTGNVSATGGYVCQAGPNGAYGSLFNIWNGPGGAHLFIDYTDFGPIMTASDYRLKENINLLTSALPLVMRLRPVTFNWCDIPDDLWRGDRTLHAGFIAHEVQDVFWGAADGKKDERTSDEKIQPQHLNQIDIVALLTRAIQELSEKVSVLENKMNDIHPELN